MKAAALNDELVQAQEQERSVSEATIHAVVSVLSESGHQMAFLYVVCKEKSHCGNSFN